MLLAPVFKSKVVSRGFIKSSIIYTVAGTLPMASSIILLPFYVSYLTTAELGQLWIYLAFSSLVQILVTFSFDSSIFVHYHEYKTLPEKLGRFLSSVFNLMLLIGLSVLAFFLLTGDFIFSQVYPEEEISFYPYGLICIVTAIFQSLFRVNNSYLMTRQSPETYLFSNILLFSLIAAFSIAGLYFFDSLIGPLGGRLVATVIAGSWAYLRIVKVGGMALDMGMIRYTFNFNFYAFIYQLQMWVMTSFDRILLSFYLPLDQVGIYGFITSCLQVVDFLVSGLYNSFSPKVVSLLVAQEIKVTTPEINRYFYGLTAMSMILVSTSIFVFPLVVQYLPEDYLQILPFIAFASLVYLFKSTRLYFGVPFGFLKYTQPLPLIYAGVLVVKVGLLVAFVNQLGINAVIFAGLISYWLEIILLFAWGRHRLHYRYNVFKLIIAPVLLTGFILTLELTLGDDFSLMVHSAYLLVCASLLLWSFRNEIRLLNPSKLFHS